MTKPARISFLFLAVTIGLAAWLHLGPLLLTILFSAFVLQKLNFSKNKWLAVGLFIVVILAIAYSAGRFMNVAVVALPQIAERSIPSMISWAQEWGVELPFTDFESLKASALETVREQQHYLRNFANIARHVTTMLVFTIIGVVVAISLFINSEMDLDRKTHRVKNNLYSLGCEQIVARFAGFYQSFATVMGAQIIISAINSVLTGIFVFSIGLKYAPVLVGVTFLCGLIPVLGNVISNTIIVAMALTMSPGTALAALIFLIVIHKLEYFLNSKIIGDRIRNPVWLTLLGLIIGERLMGVSGMILAPVVLNYIRVETSKIKVEPATAMPDEQLIEPLPPASLSENPAPSQDKIRHES